MLIGAFFVVKRHEITEMGQGFSLVSTSRGVCWCDSVRDTAFSVNLVCGLFDRCDSALTAAIKTLLNNDLIGQNF